MTLRDTIYDDLKTAMRAKDAEKLSVLRMVKASIMNREIEKGEILSDDEILRSLNTLVKQRRDSASQYEKADRPELAEKENAEIVHIESYLPQRASDEEILSAVEEAIAELDANSMKDMGAVMKATNAKLADFTVDGREVSEIVKSKLS